MTLFCPLSPCKKWVVRNTVLSCCLNWSICKKKKKRIAQKGENEIRLQLHLTLNKAHFLCK